MVDIRHIPTVNSPRDLLIGLSMAGEGGVILTSKMSLQSHLCVCVFDCKAMGWLYSSGQAKSPSSVTVFF